MPISFMNDDMTRTVMLRGPQAAVAKSKLRIFFHEIKSIDEHEDMECDTARELARQSGQRLRRGLNDCVLKQHGIPVFYRVEPDWVDKALSSEKFLERMTLDT